MLRCSQIREGSTPLSYGGRPSVVSSSDFLKKRLATTEDTKIVTGFGGQLCCVISPGEIIAGALLVIIVIVKYNLTYLESSDTLLSVL